MESRRGVLNAHYRETLKSNAELWPALRQLLRHILRMLVPEMAVGLGNQNPAIAMALPRREGLEVNAFLDGPGDEASPE